MYFPNRFKNFAAIISTISSFIFTHSQPTLMTKYFSKQLLFSAQPSHPLQTTFWHLYIPDLLNTLVGKKTFFAWQCMLHHKIRWPPDLSSQADFRLWWSEKQPSLDCEWDWVCSTPSLTVTVVGSLSSVAFQMLHYFTNKDHISYHGLLISK